VDHDQATFLEQVSSFVNQIHKVNHLNLFLASVGEFRRFVFKAIISLLLRRGPQPQDTITKVSYDIGLELEKIDLAKYVNTILTPHVVKMPPDHEVGLLQHLLLRDLLDSAA
jgi:elongator complex protein 1